MRKFTNRIIRCMLMSFVVLAFCELGHACPPGQYEQCTFLGCLCLPSSGTIIDQTTKTLNPLPDTLSVLGAAVKGDTKELSRGIGALIIKSNCKSCDIVAQNIMDKPTKEFVEQVVGRGWLLFASDLADIPALIIADPATGLARKFYLKPPPQNILAALPPAAQTKKAKRAVKTYTLGDAVCAVSNLKHVIAGWVDAPVFTENTGQKFTYPNIPDLWPGDLLVGASSGQCPAELPKGQTLAKSFKIKYNFSSAQPGTPTTMKYFIDGTELP